MNLNIYYRKNLTNYQKMLTFKIKEIMHKKPPIKTQIL